MTALWTIDDMAAAMRATRSGALPADISGISIDSRSIGKGDAFFAIQGDSRDGHEFVDAALKAGGGAAVVARGKKFPAGAPLLIVDDVLEGLRDLACAARARTAAVISERATRARTAPTPTSACGAVRLNARVTSTSTSAYFPWPRSFTRNAVDAGRGALRIVRQ